MGYIKLHLFCSIFFFLTNSIVHPQKTWDIRHVLHGIILWYLPLWYLPAVSNHLKNGCFAPVWLLLYMDVNPKHLTVWICHWHIDRSPQLNYIQKERDLCTVWVFYKTGFQHCCCSVFLSWRGEWRIDSSRGSNTGRRRLLMEKEQGSVASSASVTIPSTTSASTISNSSGRQQAVPQISVYGGITDRQTVQVERNLSHSQSIATSYSP